MKFIYSTLFLLCAFSLFSQTNKINKCGHDHWLETIEETQPGYNLKIKESFTAFKNREKSDKRLTITIPVHVIIVHPTGQPIGTGSNHSLAHVQSQIDVLNEDFGRYNSDAGNTPPEFPAADTGIQFCLATVDPDGSPTDGITRYAFDGAFVPNADFIRSETRWPRESYSNIWSAPNLPYLGEASVPSTFGLPPANDDYIHVDAATFGGPGFATLPGYNLGRTTTHEMGHWLGLFHVWANNGCGVDDGISDTPVQDDENFGCPSHPSPSCGNSGDMFMNYMDYVDDNCMNAFTQEQGEYMNTILSSSRASLNGSSFTACATSVPLTLSITSQSDPSCSDVSDGVILVEAAGGNPDYSYAINGSVPTPNNLFTDLAGGDYEIEAFDSDGNSATVNVFLNTPLPITATINVTQSNTCPSDADGIIEIQVAGGSNPYMYAINMGMQQQSNVFEGLTNGAYVINIEDANGCMLDEIFELTGANQIEISIDSTENLICSNDNMGLIIASAEGGDGPLSYSINGFEYQDSGEFQDLDGGSYFVYVQDTSGCYDSLEVVLSEPDPFFLSVNSFDASCYGFNDGYVNVNAIGGNGEPYQYSFDSITFGDATMLDSLTAGDYDLFALDSLGCIAIATFNIEEPDEIQLVADTIMDVSCFGESDGMLSIFATGGNGDYSYIYNGDTTMTAVYNDLVVGTYQFTAFDSVGCMGSGSFDVNLNSTISITIATAQSPSCYGDSDGSIEVASANTQGEIMYSINGGPIQDSPIFDGLSAGDYTLVVEDSTGCSAGIETSLTEPDSLMLQIDATNVTCFGDSDGTATFSVTGGTEPFDYIFNPDIPDPNALAAGNYSVVVKDANGCEVMDGFTITEPEELVIDSTVLDTDNFTLTVFASGGMGPYKYSYDGGDTFTDSNVTDELGASIIFIIVQDANGCETELAVGIDNVNELALDWGLNAYPNPFQDELILEIDFPRAIAATIEVFDINGRSVHNIWAKNYNTGKNFVKIDLSNFASSIYIVKIASAEGYRYIKVTKM